MVVDRDGVTEIPYEELCVLYPGYRASYDELRRLAVWLDLHGYDVRPSGEGWTIAHWAACTVSGVIKLLAEAHGTRLRMLPPPERMCN